MHSAAYVLVAGTKIMATIGPSIHDADTLTSMLEAGMAAGRVDLTWGASGWCTQFQKPSDK
jgi:pyruvate kinase